MSRTATEAVGQRPDPDTIEATTILAAGMAMAGPVAEDAENFFVLAPRGARVERVPRVGERPIRKAGSVACTDLRSFKALTDRHRSAATVVYLDRDSATVTAVIDDDGTEPGWRGRQIAYACPPSDEWAAWKSVHRHSLLQGAFVDFLEDWRMSIKTPDAAELLEVIRDLKGRKDVGWRNGVDLRTGAVKLEYVEEVSAESTRAGAMEMPAELTLRLEVFMGQGLIDVPVRLRYAIDKTVLAFRPVIDQPDQVEEQALRELATELEGYWKDGGPLVVWATPPAPRAYP